MRPTKGPAVPSTCPRCARALPPSATKLCVYCGARLSIGPLFPPVRDPAVGTTSDPLVGETVAERFRIEQLIGQGGMGKVYRARHLSLDRTVCLKILKPALAQDATLVSRFEREAKAASRLNHPNCIHVLDFGRVEADGTLYIAMEYVQGKDLRLILRDEWPLSEDRLCRIMAQVLAALDEAHAQNVIHRDLKPENIMVEQRREHADFVKVLDFGIAKIIDPDAPGLTRQDVVCGTPQYMAPEQATGGALDHRCDLYAVGIILYQMATGHLPFDSPSAMEVLTRHVHEAPVPPRQKQPDAPISEEMEALILRALEKDPARRPQTAEKFREELLTVPQRARRRISDVVLQAVEASGGAIAPAVALAQALAPRRPLFITALAAVAAATALTLAGVLVWARARPPARGETSPVAAAVALDPPPPRQRDAQRASELLARAQEWLHNGDAGMARELLEEAVERDPENAEAHYRLGGLYLNSQPERAKREYELARKLEPGRYAEVVSVILEKLQ